jgi:hypothetical protein
MTCLFSPDRVYRYTLWREWSDDLFNNHTKEGYVMWVGLNPSVADETINDPTIRRCMGFTKRFGYLQMCMTNLFAFRATDPDVMKAAADPVGPENMAHLEDIAAKAKLIIAAWGNHGEFKGQSKRLLEVIGRLRIPFHCLRVTGAGHPQHPLYLLSTLNPIPYCIGLQPNPK